MNAPCRNQRTNALVIPVRQFTRYGRPLSPPHGKSEKFPQNRRHVLQVRPKVHDGVLRGYVGRVMYRPVVFHKLPDVLDFGTVVFARVQRNLHGHFCIR